MAKITEPTLGVVSCNCPHCGAFANQTWFECYASEVPEPPTAVTPFQITSHIETLTSMEDRNAARTAFSKTMAGFVWLSTGSNSFRSRVDNFALSQCFGCKEFALWLYDKLIFPSNSLGIVANENMPADIALDFREAASIVGNSPRGAAALLRLCVQRLCKHLGEKGQNINTDIGNLVRKGLSQQIQQALDIVRVIGNNAVHPGQIDLNDDRAAAYSLFSIVNLIVEIMISQPKHIRDTYMQLPASAAASSAESSPRGKRCP
jgi:Domain of unknown function (DUF4145)